jgi:hypothetical protein
MTCTWIRNKGSDTSSDFGGYSFFVSGWLSKSSHPLCSSHFCPIAKIWTFTSKRVPGYTAGNYRRSYRRLIYPTRLSQYKYNFLLSRLEINCTLGDSVQMNLEGRVVNNDSEGYSHFISSLRRGTQANQSEVTRWKLVQSTHTRSSSQSTACSGKKVILNRSLCVNVFQTFVAISDTESSILVDLTQSSRFWKKLGYGANASSMIDGNEHHVGLQDGLVGDPRESVRVFRVQSHGDGYPFDRNKVYLARGF